jgi:YndJ-like protein
MNDTRVRSVRLATVIGAMVWIAILVISWNPNLGLGTIEKLFLLGPLMVVPLGLQLAGMENPCLLAMAAAGVVASFLSPVGKLAGLLTIPWLLMCGFAGVLGMARVVKTLTDGRFNERQLCQTTATIGLVVGGVGLLQSRSGMQPLGFREPLILLVAVHFHFAAFVTPLVAGEVLERLVDRRGKARWILLVSALGGSPLLAAGYVLHVAALRFLGAALLVVSLVLIAFWILARWKDLTPYAARVLLGTSAVSVVAAMAYAAVYATADFFGQVWIAIPQMARTHGVINAVGFSVCGLLGWLAVETDNKKRLGSLTRKWQ